jgi:hypothetical protein
MIRLMSPNQLHNKRKEAIRPLKHQTRFIKKFRHDTDDNFYPLQAAELFAGYYRQKLAAESEGRVSQSRVLDALIACLVSLEARIVGRDAS